MASAPDSTPSAGERPERVDGLLFLKEEHIKKAVEDITDDTKQAIEDILAKNEEAIHAMHLRPTVVDREGAGYTVLRREAHDAIVNALRDNDEKINIIRNSQPLVQRSDHPILQHDVSHTPGNPSRIQRGKQLLQSGGKIAAMSGAAAAVASGTASWLLDWSGQIAASGVEGYMPTSMNIMQYASLGLGVSVAEFVLRLGRNKNAALRKIVDATSLTAAYNRNLRIDAEYRDIQSAARESSLLPDNINPAVANLVTNNAASRGITPDKAPRFCDIKLEENESALDMYAEWCFFQMTDAHTQHPQNLEDLRSMWEASYELARALQAAHTSQNRWQTTIAGGAALLGDALITGVMPAPIAPLALVGIHGIRKLYGWWNGERSQPDIKFAPNEEGKMVPYPKNVVARETGLIKAKETVRRNGRLYDHEALMNASKIELKDGSAAQHYHKQIQIDATALLHERGPFQSVEHIAMTLEPFVISNFVSKTAFTAPATDKQKEKVEKKKEKAESFLNEAKKALESAHSRLKNAERKKAAADKVLSTAVAPGVDRSPYEANRSEAESEMAELKGGKEEEGSIKYLQEIVHTSQKKLEDAEKELDKLENPPKRTIVEKTVEAIKQEIETAKTALKEAGEDKKESKQKELEKAEAQVSIEDPEIRKAFMKRCHDVWIEIEKMQSSTFGANVKKGAFSLAAGAGTVAVGAGLGVVGVSAAAGVASMALGNTFIGGATLGFWGSLASAPLFAAYALYANRKEILKLGASGLWSAAKGAFNYGAGYAAGSHAPTSSTSKPEAAKPAAPKEEPKKDDKPH